MRLPIFILAAMTAIGPAAAQPCRMQELNRDYLDHPGLPPAICEAVGLSCEAPKKDVISAPCSNQPCGSTTSTAPKPVTFDPPRSLDAIGRGHIDRSDTVVVAYRPVSEEAFSALTAVPPKRLEAAVLHGIGILHNEFEPPDEVAVRATEFAPGALPVTDIHGYCRHRAVGRTEGPTAGCSVVAFRHAAMRYALMAVGTQPSWGIDGAESANWTGRSRDTIMASIAASPFHGEHTAVFDRSESRSMGYRRLLCHGDRPSGRPRLAVAGRRRVAPTLRAGPSGPSDRSSGRFDCRGQGRGHRIGRCRNLRTRRSLTGLEAAHAR